jgi:asparaginyl-tRNA synthetase
MTKYISIKEAMKKGSGKVAVRGWVYRERGSNKMKFIVLRDSSDIIQCVVKREEFDKQWGEIDGLKIESSVELEGTIKKDERAPTGYEISVSKINVVQIAEDYPLNKDSTEEALADKRHLALRSRKMTAIMKIRHTVLAAFREYYSKQDYYEFSPPILQPTQCEGGSTLFSVNYYDKKLYLAQTGQLYTEAYIYALEKTFVVSPTFRAEKSNTSRHLSEFWMAEMEATWMRFPELVEDVEKLVKFIIGDVLKKNKSDLEILERDVSKLEPIVKKPFNRMTYTEVLEFLKKEHKMDVKWGKDLRTVEEQKLSQHFDVPTIVTHYPKEVMAFYKPKDPQDSKVAVCLDVIAPEGYCEIIGGSERDLDIEELKKVLSKDGEDLSGYEFYFDTRRYGSVPHCGHGMGVERVVSWICGLDTIKDAIPFPRTMRRFNP